MFSISPFADILHSNPKVNFLKNASFVSLYWLKSLQISIANGHLQSVVKQSFHNHIIPISYILVKESIHHVLNILFTCIPFYLSLCWQLSWDVSFPFSTTHSSSFYSNSTFFIKSSAIVFHKSHAFRDLLYFVQQLGLTYCYFIIFT